MITLPTLPIKTKILNKIFWTRNVDDLASPTLKYSNFNQGEKGRKREKMRVSRKDEREREKKERDRKRIGKERG
ncbi:hypothetical protein RclHR1_07730008 [Rhizophagus clarus]|uniref:Uncharacterized protein n=1 Tax=Rhizophagus clarus TaxID=94130 RepID=A0A2Z6S9P0_9GLOM|nr:hypothetical protein RclHR1_07730008 [Rhizophagus clarus]